MNPPTLRVGLAGLGTVGASVVRLLAKNRDAINARAGRPITLARVASRTPKPDVDLGGATFGTEVASLPTSPVDVVVELIGGEEAAGALVEASLRAGCAVVTANKALLAARGNALFALAAAEGLPFGYEASVAGGIPIVQALHAGLAANRRDLLAGIVNGTSNYILTAMENDGQDFAAALAEAQRLGYAEADPAFDVDGLDAAQKLAVLSAAAFDTDIDYAGVHVEGIAGVDVEDIRYARELGFAVKHLAIARRRAEGLDARVHLALVPEHLLMAKVSGVMNAVLAHGDAVGSTLHIGPGAGGMATASAVVADLVALARGDLPVPKPAGERLPALGVNDLVCAHYLKIPAVDQAGVFAEVADVLRHHDISIEAVIQRPAAARTDAEPWVPIVILTNEVAERAVESAVAELRRLDGVAGVAKAEAAGGGVKNAITRIRVADL